MFDLSDVSDDALCDDVFADELATRRAAAHKFRRLAELDRRGTCAREFGVATGDWVAWRTGRNHAACRREVSTATKLCRHFPAVVDALEQGEISEDHALTIANAANPRIVEQF